MTPAERWLTVQEAAAYCHVSPWTLYRAVERNELYAGRARSRAIRLRTLDLDRWLQHGLRIPRARIPAKSTDVPHEAGVGEPINFVAR